MENKSVVISLPNMNRLFAFLIGFLSANNIIYVFKVSNTTIKAIGVVAIIGLIYIAIRSEKISSPFHMLPNSLRYFFLYVIMSFVPVLVFNQDLIYQWAVGIVAMLIMASVTALVLLLYESYKEDIFKGIYVGFLVNALLILWGLYNHSRGISFTLDEFFPYESIAPVYLGTSYRGSGLFREPGHLMRYTTVFCLPLIYYFRTNRRRMIISIISTIIILANTRSSTAIAFGIEIVLLILIFSSKDAKSFWKAFALIIAIVIAAVIITPIRNFILNKVFSGFVDFTTFRGETARITGMINALKVALKYPALGSGWNTLSMMYEKLGLNIYISNGFGGGAYVSAAYSEGLTILAETGAFSLMYYWFVLKSSISLIKYRDELSITLGVSLVGYFILFFITDFSFNLNGSVAVLIGLTVGRLLEDQNSEWINNLSEITIIS